MAFFVSKVWVEINLPAAEWRIPASKMKMRMLHIVPLSTQAIDILQELYALTGSEKYIFSGVRSKKSYMSENTVNAALRRKESSVYAVCDVVTEPVG